MKTPSDYYTRVYAGVLGKIVGVYLGRPFEGWAYRDILKKLGPIEYYVHEQLKKPLIVSDDDITGTFTFLRALEDHAESGASITSEQIGRTWLNYIIENRSILWWGGMGLSTEHTAFLRLQDGTPAPASGSIALNGKLVAEQIGAQIFIDGWAMVAPGDPELAASLAERAAKVSHDGEAVHAAVVIAAMESAAFVESDLNKLLDIGVSFIPKSSLVYKLISDLRAFRATNDDWEAAMVQVLEAHYGYDKYGGNCHVIPNHGVVILSLLYCDDDFDRALMIANTCGWDTDCNSANVGCLMGIKNGLAGIDAGRDWRGPVADRVLLPTADGGWCINDAASLALMVTNFGRRLAGEPALSPKDGAKFHFSLPGSVQGFLADKSDDVTPVKIRNVDGSLAIQFDALQAGKPARASTPTFRDLGTGGGYDVVASPTIYSTQQLSATVRSDASMTSDVVVRPFVRHYTTGDTLVRAFGESTRLAPGVKSTIRWTIPETNGFPIAEVGFDVSGTDGATGTLLVERLTWSGTPTLLLRRHPDVLSPQRAWVEGCTSGTNWDPYVQFRFLQNHGRGLLMHGTRDWTDYTASTRVEPVLASTIGVAARVQGLRRYYALLLTTSSAGSRVVRLVKMRDGETILAEKPFDWTFGDGVTYAMSVTVSGNHISGAVDGIDLRATDDTLPLTGGAFGFVIADGRGHAHEVTITPVE